MTPRARLLIIGSVVIAWNAPRPAYGIFGLERLRFFRPASERPTRPVAHLEGQKARVIPVRKVKPDDLIPPLEDYLSGIKSEGSIVVDPSGQAILVNDFPEIVDRVETLVRAMDQDYDNPSPLARRALARQQMMRAIRGLSPLSVGSAAARSPVAARPSPAFAPAAETAPTPTASSSAPAMPSLDDTRERQHMRVIEDMPPLEAFQLIGWVRDDKGLIIVLRNSGQRYIYRGGRLLYGSLASRSYVNGIEGRVQGQDLLLTQLGRTVTISMKPRGEK